MIYDRGRKSELETMQDRIYSLKKDALLRDTLKANLNTRLTEGRELKKIRDAHGEPRKIELNESCIRNLVNREREREMEAARDSLTKTKVRANKRLRLRVWKSGFIETDRRANELLTAHPVEMSFLQFAWFLITDPESPGIDAEVNQTRERRAD